MANAKCAVIAMFSTFKNDFYVTASPALRQWSQAGGRYSVDGECVSRSIGNDIQGISFRELDQIVFIGQYLQPKRLFRSGELHSRSVIKRIIDAVGFPIYLPDSHYNEPLELFPRLAPGKCTILCDPLPIAGIHPSCIKVFLDEVKHFGNENGIKIIFQPQNTLDRSMQTSSVFKRTKSTTTHFDEAFWQIYIAHAKRSLVMTPLRNPIE